MGCLHCHNEYTSVSKQSSCATANNNKVDGDEQRKEEKTVVVGEKKYKSDVCVRENERKVVEATTKNPSGGTRPDR